MYCLVYKGTKRYKELPSNINDCENMILFKKIIIEYCKNY